MNRYQRGKIYKIISHTTDKVYIGSTTEPTLACRMAKHRRQYLDFQRGKASHYTCFELLATGAATIVLLESYPCNSKDELYARERHYIENTPNCVNKNIPGRGRIETCKAYYLRNRDDIARKAAYRVMCKCGSLHRYGERSKHYKTKKHKVYAARQEARKELIKKGNEIVANYMKTF